MSLPLIIGSPKNGNGNSDFVSILVQAKKLVSKAKSKYLYVLIKVQRKDIKIA